jgi:hypothetical protein
MPSRAVRLAHSQHQLEFTLTRQQGRMTPAGMITKTIRLDEVVDEGFNTLINDKENHVKILVDVGAGLSGKK